MNSSIKEPPINAGSVPDYHTVSLTLAGRSFDPIMPLDFVMKAVTCGPTKGKRRKLANKSKTPAEAASRRKPVHTKAGTYLASANGKTGIEQILRAWRLGEAKKRNIPAFRIFGDQALRNIVAARPRNEAELLTLPGVGTSIVKKYGRQIYRLIADASPRPEGLNPAKG